MADAQRTLEVIIRARDEASAAVKSFGQSFSDLADRARVGSAVIVGALGLVTSSAVSLAADFQSARVSFETFLGSGEKAGKLLKELSDFAVKTPFDLPSVVDGAKRLLAYGIAADNIIPVFRKLGDLSSGNKVRLDQLVLAYGQVRAATRLTGQELRQFTEAGVPLLEVLGQQMGKTAGDIKDMITANEISFEEVDSALSALNSSGGRFFQNMERQATTFKGVMSNIRDEFARFAIGVLGFTEQGELQKGSLFYYLDIGAKNFLAVLQQVRPVAQQFMLDLLNNMPAVIAIVGALVGLLTPLLMAFVAMIAPALLFAAAGAAIGAAIGFVIANIQMLEPYFPIILGALAAIATLIAIVVVPAFITWGIAAVTAAAATVVALLPVIAIAAAVGAAVALLAAAWKNNWLNIRGATEAVVKYFKDTVLPFIQSEFGQGMLKVIDLVSGGWVTRLTQIKNAVESVTRAIGDMINKAREIGEGIKGGLKIPGFQHGGFVPGAYGDASLAVVHGGERIVPRNGTDVNGGGAPSVTINISGSFNLDSDSRVSELADKVVRLLGRQNELAARGVGY